MNATQAAVDLDDAEGLLAADRDGLLRAASMAGAQVRATAAALDEGDLDALQSDQPPRTVIWVAGRGNAETAGAMLAATLGGSVAAPIVVASEAPPWIGALDVLVVAGDDPGDPALVRRPRPVCGAARASSWWRPTRARCATRRPAGPCRWRPALWVRDDFGLARYLAAGLAVLQVVDPGLRVDLAALADELDAEALRNSAGRELFTNPAKTLAERMSGRDVVLAGDNAATLALARHGAAVLLRIAHEAVAAVGLADALVALHGGLGGESGADHGKSIFHDEQIDGPLPRRVRTFVLTTDAERPVVLARVSGLDDVDVVNAEDVPEASGTGWTRRWRRAPGRASGTTIGDVGRSVGDDGHLPATGSRLSECTCYAERCGPTHGVREPPLPISPDGQVPQRIPRRSCGSARTPVIRRGWRPTRASGRCSTRCETIRKVSWARPCAAASAIPCRSWSRCSRPTNRCRCRPIRAPSRRWRGSPARKSWASRSSAPTRNYRDRSHKPELLVALGQFEALAGFRPAANSVELMRALAVTDLDPFVNLLSGQSDADGLRALFTTWITAPQPDLDVLVPAVIEGAIHYLRSGKKKFAAEAKTVLELGERYPGDAGVLASLLLNRISLKPGEAIYMPAGNLHAYLHGVGVEVMANSDNVLRGGLTPKHVDVPELLRVLDFTPATDDVIHPRITRDGTELVYSTPAPEFAVSVLCIDGEHLGHEIDAPTHHDGPQILLCAEGSTVVHAKSTAVTLERGAAAWVAADDGPIRLVAQTPTKLFRATVGI